MQFSAESNLLLASAHLLHMLTCLDEVIEKDKIKKDFWVCKFAFSSATAKIIFICTNFCLRHLSNLFSGDIKIFNLLFTFDY